MTPRELEEYKALRATIRERGTARVCLFVAGIAVWAALVVALTVLTVLPAAGFLTLFFLASTFEAVFTLHVGVERIGRYLQVFHEAPDDRASWEAAAMAFGPPRGASTDPLFIVSFAIATVLNFAPVLLAAPHAAELAGIGAAHLAFLARMMVARRAAGGQRAADLARFKEMASRPE
jgi:hypothetical protein